MSQDQSNRVFDKLDKFEDKFDRKIERIDKRLDGVEKELVIYNEQLKYHIEGVRQLKQENKMLREYIDIETIKLQEQFAPVVNHVESIKSFGSGLKKVFQTISYIVTILGTIAGLIYTITLMLGK
jgi:predicted transcriptional regulator